MNVVSDCVRGTIWWDFDGTLVSRPLMWSRLRQYYADLAGYATDAGGVCCVTRSRGPT